MNIRCAECQCIPECCDKTDNVSCSICTKDLCCCSTIHEQKLATKKSTFAIVDDCCVDGACKNNVNIQHSQSRLRQFFSNVKRMYAAALGIEILCISAASIGENIGLYIFGLNHIGIPISYAMGYGSAAFATFAAILGRYKYNEKINSCCSVLDQNSQKGLMVNLVSTFTDFARGLKKIAHLHKQKELKRILKTSIYILVTAESACILTAETVDLAFYNSSILLSIPLALLVGAFTVVALESYKISRHQ